MQSEVRDVELTVVLILSLVRGQNLKRYQESRRYYGTITQGQQHNHNGLEHKSPIDTIVVLGILDNNHVVA